MKSLSAEFGRGLIRLFFPHICPGCGSDLLSEHQTICLQCLHRLPRTGFENLSGNPVEKIFWGRLPLVAASSYLYFSKSSSLQRLLHQFKYGGQKEIGLFLGRIMGEAIVRSGRFSEADALIPLPLAATRERSRGYNQALVLCKGIAASLPIPVWDDALFRPLHTESQTRKNRIDRWQNMAGKFVCRNPDRFRSRHLMLIDDVITTGATLEAAGHALVSIPGLKLSLASLAYTPA